MQDSQDDVFFLFEMVPFQGKKAIHFPGGVKPMGQQKIEEVETTKDGNKMGGHLLPQFFWCGLVVRSSPPFPYIGSMYVWYIYLHDWLINDGKLSR